ncbi:MAG TPA: FHA domain-containing protein [Roseiflexaceae bacterium]|nr:FHA domain-containing protein [Roseiflexaceae bacterium]
MHHGTTLPHARLLALHADIQPDDFTLEADVCTIGRSPLCQIVVPRGTVSRLHARVEREGPRYVLRDAGSANGTFVNGQLISGPHLLKDSDAIGLGSAAELLRFFDPDPTVVPSSRLRFDERALTFYLGQQPLDLTQSQLRLLRHLYQHIGEVCTRESCAAAIWGRDYDPGVDADALDRAVSNLRAIMRQIDPEADLIKTRRGIGYTLQIAEN